MRPSARAGALSLERLVLPVSRSSPKDSEDRCSGEALPGQIASLLAIKRHSYAPRQFRTACRVCVSCLCTNSNPHSLRLEKVKIPSSRNPLLASSVNPFLATSLNPRFASSLNQNLASSKNPFMASSLNPRMASRINPKRASSLNYRLSSSINPSLSSRLNPNLSSSINPNLRSNIAGLYLFNLNRQPVGFTVRASERVNLVFSPECEFQAVLVEAREGFWNIFDLSNEWIGFWIHARGNVWLRFDLTKEWIGFTT